MERIGLIAGAGDFPITFAKEAKKKGVSIVGFAIKEITSPNFNLFVDKIHWIDPRAFKLQKFVFALLTSKVKKMVMVGKFDKSLLFGKFGKNDDVNSVLRSVKDNMDYSILEDVTRRLGQIGIKVIDGLDYLADLLPVKGILTKRIPSEIEELDIDFGIQIAKKIALLDVGQTVTVKNRAVVTVEAMEGTDNTIIRAGELTGGGFTVIKVARPKQDMRWDVPLVGLDTIVTMIESKASILAIESGRTFLVDKAKVIKEADLNGLAIVVV